MTLRLFNYSEHFAPPGKTVAQVYFETEWDYWSALQHDRTRYDAAKAQLAAEALAALERRYPGIAAEVEVTDVATPYTTWRYTLNRHGAYTGWLPTPTALMTSVRRTLPGLSRFYMAGQWVMPGGGVTPSLYSGKHAVQLLCRDDGKRFTAGAT
jgi:phytoene dehydrogenase-like protein